MMRLLILSHGHPTFSAGGAERAAYSLFEHMKNRPEISKVFFAAHVPQNYIGHDANFSLFRGLSDEILLCVPGADDFTYQSYNYNRLKSTLDDLLRYTRPDIVHVHHFFYFGLDVINIVKSYGAKVVFTLHEYLTICHNFGQMVKTNGRLCHVSSPLECSMCFPNFSPGKFFLRKKIIEKLMSLCDVLISPSEFLAARYLDWSSGHEGVQVVENPLSPRLLSGSNLESKAKNQSAPKSFDSSQTRVRIGYFGQLNPFKGISVLLESLKLLPENATEAMYVGIHGANLEVEDKRYQSHFFQLVTELKSFVFNFGSYDNTSVTRLMKEYDWIVVPSIWWENSPVVIQEARLAGVPLICSALGGIVEKADDPRNIMFEVGNPMSLARGLIRSLSSKNDTEQNVELLIRQHQGAVERHIDIYRTLFQP